MAGGVTSPNTIRRPKVYEQRALFTRKSVQTVHTHLTDQKRSQMDLYCIHESVKPHAAVMVSIYHALSYLVIYFQDCRSQVMRIRINRPFDGTGIYP